MMLYDDNVVDDIVGVDDDYDYEKGGHKKILKLDFFDIFTFFFLNIMKFFFVHVKCV